MGGEMGDEMSQRPQMDERALQGMKRGMTQALKGITMAEKQFAKFAAKGCAVSADVTAAIESAKASVAEIGNLKPEDLEEGPPESLMALQDLHGVIQEAMDGAQSCMNLTPMRKQIVKQLKQWDKVCKKIEKAADRNDSLGEVADECRSAFDAADAAFQAGDDAKASGDSDGAQEAYESVFEYGEAIFGALQKMEVLKNAKSQVKAMTREVKDLQRKLKDADRKGFDVGNLSAGIDELKQAVIDFNNLAKARGTDPEDLLEAFDNYQDLLSEVLDGFDEVFGTEHEYEGVKGVEQFGNFDLGNSFNQYLTPAGGEE